MPLSVSLLMERVRVPSALRHRNYRLYWTGLLVSIIGWQIQQVAQFWLIYELTNSPLYLGLVGFCWGAPVLALSLVGGVVADRVDRRKLLMLTQSLLAMLLLTLAILTASGVVTVWHILTIAFLRGVVDAFNQPAQHALLPSLIERKDLTNAVALVSSVWQISRIIGPAAAGMFVGFIGSSGCFYIASAGFLVMVISIYFIRRLSWQPAQVSEGLWKNLTKGISYIRHSAIFSTLIGFTFANSIFGMSYVYLMPVFARDVFNVGSSEYGFLLGASGIGALCGTIVIASLGEFRHKGYLLLSGATVFGITLVLFALCRSYIIALPLLFISGMANSVYMVLTNSLLQVLVPDNLRGRVMAIYGLTWSLMPLGGMQGGLIAEFLSAPAAICIGGTVIALLALTIGVTLSQIRKLT